jgi:hypothetical protein
MSFLNPTSENRSCLLTGPHGIGKRSFILDVVSNFSQEDVMVVEPGVDGARSIVEFLSTTPIIESFRIAVILNTDLMQLPSQDAYLKIFEEPPLKSKIIFLADDDGLISDPLKSRTRMCSRWTCLSDMEMRAFAAEYGQIDEIVLSVSDGHPGIYHIIHDDQRVSSLINILSEAISGKRDLLLEHIPDMISELDTKSPVRIAVSCLIKKIANNHIGKIDIWRITPVFQYASLIASSLSLNSELYWLRMASNLRPLM